MIHVPAALPAHSAPDTRVYGPAQFAGPSRARAAAPALLDVVQCVLSLQLDRLLPRMAHYCKSLQSSRDVKSSRATISLLARTPNRIFYGKVEDL